MKKEYKILLIDDDEDDRLLFKEAVSEIDANIICETAEDSIKGLSKLNVDELPNIIFLDLNMHAVDGFDCLLLIKNHELLKNIPIVIYSTSDSIFHADRAGQQGAVGYLKKPDNFIKLREKLSKILLIDFSDNNYIGFL